MRSQLLATQVLLILFLVLLVNHRSRRRRQAILVSIDDSIHHTVHVHVLVAIRSGGVVGALLPLIDLFGSPPLLPLLVLQDLLLDRRRHCSALLHLHICTSTRRQATTVLVDKSEG